MNISQAQIDELLSYVNLSRLDDEENRKPTKLKVKSEILDSDSEAEDKENKQKKRKKKAAPKVVEPTPEELAQTWTQKLELAILEKKKKHAKDLYPHWKEIVEHCDDSLLRRAMWEKYLLSFPEGRKLVARFVEKVTPFRVRVLIHKRITFPDEKITDDMLTNYGEFILTAWLQANREDNQDLSMNIEHEIITMMFNHAQLMKSPVDMKFFKMLMPFARYTDKRRIDTMIFRCSRPTIWRCVESVNPKVRYLASMLLLEFYPIIPDVAEDRHEFFQKQHELIGKMLVDDCRVTRQECIPRVLLLLSKFFTYIPSEYRKDYIIKIADHCSKDADTMTRSAVIQSLGSLLRNPSCLSMAETIYKCVLPRAINDKHEDVRLRAAKLLNSLKKYRYIKFDNVVSLDVVMQRLEIESADSVRRELVSLVTPIVIPRDTELQREHYGSIKLLLKFGREAALAIYQLAFTVGMLTLKDALAHVKHMVMFISQMIKSVRNSNNESLMNDTANCTLNTTTGSVMRNFNLNDENCEDFSQFKLLLDCLTLFCQSLKKELSNPENAKEDARVQNLLAWVFNACYEQFQETSAIGSILTIATLIPPNAIESSKLKIDMLSLLDNTDSVTFEPYLEVVAHWKVDLLFKAITTGLEALKEYPGNDLPPKPKKPKKGKNAEHSPNEAADKGLKILTYLLKSFRSAQMITGYRSFELEQFYTRLSIAQEAITSELQASAAKCKSFAGSDDGSCTEPEPSTRKRVIELDTLALALSVRLRLCTIVMNCCKEERRKNSEENRERALLFLKDAVQDLKWFQSNVMSSIAQLSHDEELADFLMKISEDLLRYITQMIYAWDFSTLPTPSKAPSFARGTQGQQDSFAGPVSDAENSLDFLGTSMSLVRSFSSSGNPAALIGPVATATRVLLENSPELFEDAREILNYLPRWIAVKEQGNDDELRTLNVKTVSEAIWLLLRVVRNDEHFLMSHLNEFNDKLVIAVSSALATLLGMQNGILDPRESTFEIPISCQILLRVACRQNEQFECFLNTLGSQAFSSSYLPANVSAEERVYRLSFLVQAAYIAEKLAPATLKTKECIAAINAVVDAVRREFEATDLSDLAATDIQESMESLLKPVEFAVPKLPARLRGRKKTKKQEDSDEDNENDED